MKKQIIALGLLPLSFFSFAQQQSYDATQEVMQLFNQQPQLTPNQQQMITVGSNFANIIFNALSIMANKDDTQALSNNISGIMNSFVNIAIEASKDKLSDKEIDKMVSAVKTFCQNLQKEELKMIIKTINKQMKTQA